MRLQNLIYHLIVSLLLVCISTSTYAQPDNKTTFKAPSTSVWLGTYTNLRITDKLFWAGEFHFRTTEHNDIRFVGRAAQIYNRHGISYRIKPNFIFTLGPVVRLNFTPDPGNPEFKKMVVEPRIWHEYLFGMPFNRIMFYHRFRIEHRWSKENKKGDDWIYRDRWRYKAYLAVPINNKKLIPGTWYFAPDFEIIIQSGKPVNGSFLEDIRFYPQFGYIASSNVKYTAGFMYTTGQTLRDPYEFNTRWVARFNVYLSYDIRKLEQRVPEIRIFD